MAHESFEDNEVAEALNRDFICVKVDREERPDIDAVYMAVCQALTGSGGWPLTIVMTPEQKPFFAGTYLPKKTEFGRTGLLELLSEITKLWGTKKDLLQNAGDEIISELKNVKPTYGQKSEVTKELPATAAAQLKRSFDPEWGGFGGAPKFPAPQNLLFLLRYSALENDTKALHIAENTLEHLFRGGIFDHVGGGFCRYSTDEKWLVPHFEKMLYDNALLVYTYTEAYGRTRRPLYQKVAEQTLVYVLSELQNPEGAFQSGQDADSDGVEGKYYVFSPDEVLYVLGGEDGEVFCRHFGITEKGNFEGKSIPNLLLNPNYEKSIDSMLPLCRRLYEYRLHRTTLHKDDKVLCSWNALMIAALSRAGAVFHKPEYLEDAKKAQRFIAEKLTDKTGKLLVRWRDGEAAINGHIDDYAFYCFALISLYDCTYEAYYLKEAIRIAELMTELFFDSRYGGFYFYSTDGEKLISRPKEVYDGAMPSGNSVAAYCLSRLAALSGQMEIIKTADLQLKYIASETASYPSAYSFSMQAILQAVYPSAELICATSENSVPAELHDLLQEGYSQNLHILLKTPENANQLAEAAEFTAAYPLPQSGSLYYLCRDKRCFAPQKNIAEIKAFLKGERGAPIKRA